MPRGKQEMAEQIIPKQRFGGGREDRRDRADLLPMEEDVVLEVCRDLSGSRGNRRMRLPAQRRGMASR